jgi:hypothetical protein
MVRRITTPLQLLMFFDFWKGVLFNLMDSGQNLLRLLCGW